MSNSDDRFDELRFRPPDFFGEEDVDEDLIVHWVNVKKWEEWEPAYRPYWKLVEENIRVLSGRQYDMYVDEVGEFVDLASYFRDGFDAWRDFPTYNWLAHWFKLTLSKLTENVPAMGYVPTTGDQKDALLAQLMEPFFKFEWDQMEVPEKMFDLYGWVLVGARGIVKLKWDPDRGMPEEYRGPAIFNQIGEDNQVTQRQISDAPYWELDDGEFGPAFQQDDDGEILTGIDGRPDFGRAHVQPIGDLDCEIVSPLNVITPHGPTPFHEKPWLTHRYMMPIEEAERRFQLRELEPMVFSGKDNVQAKANYGTHYGMPSQGFSSVTNVDGKTLEGSVQVTELWHKPMPGHKILDRGRLTIVVNDRVGYDDINPYWVAGSHELAIVPFEAYDLIKYPFRQEGTTDIEIMTPLQKAMNRRFGALQDAVDYHEQPIKIVDRNAGIEETASELNKRGAVIMANITSNVPPIQTVQPPDIPQSSMVMFEKLQQMLQILGSQPFGSEGLPVTNDASGELQKEVRFDTDRVWGATLRRHSYVHARLAIKMKEIAAAMMDDKRLLIISGEDQAFKAITVGPELFSGKVNVRPHPESQQLESRQEKQNRLMALYQAGLLPPQQVLEQMGYPDLSRAIRPGGEAYAMAQREHMEIALGGAPVALIEHDHATHLLLHKAEQQSVWYRDSDDEIQDMLRLHIEMHELLQVQEALRQLAIQAPLLQATAALQGQAAKTADEEGPHEDAEPNGKPKSSGSNGKPAKSADGGKAPSRVRGGRGAAPTGGRPSSGN